MKKISIVLILFIALQSCEKRESSLITFTIMNTSSKMYNGKIEPVSYVSQKPIFSKTFNNLKRGEELVVKMDRGVIKNVEGSYYITLTDPSNRVLKKEFGGFDGYDLYQRKYFLTVTETGIE